MLSVLKVKQILSGPCTVLGVRGSSLLKLITEHKCQIVQLRLYEEIMLKHVNKGLSIDGTVTLNLPLPMLKIKLIHKVRCNLAGIGVLSGALMF